MRKDENLPQLLRVYFPVTEIFLREAANLAMLAR